MGILPGNITSDLHLESSITVSALSFTTFVILCILLALHWKGDDFHFCLNNAGNAMVLFLGALISIIATLAVPGEEKAVYMYYKFSIQMVVGIILAIVGCNVFFETSSNPHEKSLGHHHHNISFLIWVVTIPLVIIELLKAIAAITMSPDKFTAVTFFVVMVQKLVQANLYHFNLRHKVAHPDKPVGASLYLKILSLFNFVMWLDSIMTGKDGNKLLAHMFAGHKGNSHERENGGYNIIFYAENALLIDYHLLCCLLFAEHALEIDCPSDEDDQEDDGAVVPDNTFRSLEQFRVGSTQMSGLGFVFGLTCIMLQLICGIQYLGMVGPWTNIFPIMADTSVAVLGLTLLNVAGNLQVSSDAWRETNSKGLDAMVAMMGVTGFLFWMILSIFTACWANSIDSLSDEQVHMLRWSCAKNFFRTFGILFQLFIFMKSDPFIGCRRNVRKRSYSYFILPALMLSLLSVFIMAIIDGHSSAIETFLHHSKFSHVLQVLLEAGEPLYLGFCLHLFLHFFIINHNMKEKQQASATRTATRSRGTVRPKQRRKTAVPAHTLYTISEGSV